MLNSDTTSVLEKANNILSRIKVQKILQDSNRIRRTSLLEANNILSSAIKLKTEELNTNIEAKEYYVKAIDYIYENSIGELKGILNNALSYIFYDKDYEIEFVFGNSRNKTLQIMLKENDKVINLKSGTGASARSVVSFILLTYYLLAKNSYPILFLDEMYTQVSSDYVEKFFEYINELCEQKNFSIVLITHDARFINYADKIYRLAEGTIIEEKDQTKHG